MCNGRWKHLSNEPHELNMEESFSPKHTCVLLSREGAAEAGWQISWKCPLHCWCGGGGKGHQKPWLGVWGPFSWFRKLCEVSIGGPSRTWLKIKRPPWGPFRASSRLVAPTEFMKKGNDGKPEVASAFDQQPTTRVAYWGDVVKEGLANSLIKRWTRRFLFFIYL